MTRAFERGNGMVVARVGPFGFCFQRHYHVPGNVGLPILVWLWRYLFGFVIARDFFDVYVGFALIEFSWGWKDEPQEGVAE